jgi:hypothetical protein
MPLLRKHPFPFAFLVLLAVAGAFAFAVYARPPDASSRLESVLGVGLGAEPARYNSAALGTTILEAVAADNTLLTDQATQQFVVTNYSASGNVCLGSVAASATNCNTLCGTAGSWTGQGFAATMNCTAGDASMGSIIPAGQSRTFRYDGTRCVCIVGSTTSMSVQVERLVR